MRAKANRSAGHCHYCGRHLNAGEGWVVEILEEPATAVLCDEHFRAWLQGWMPERGAHRPRP